MIRKRFMLFYLIVLFFKFSGLIHAQGTFNLINNRNHPELSWYVYATDNFNIVFSNGLDNIAEKVGNYAEQLYEIHKKNMGLHFKKKYYIFISDMDDIPNGATTPYGYFFIWVNPSDYTNYFTGVDGWTNKVVAHEMVHALVFENSKTWLNLFFPPLYNFSISLDIHEGMAQYYAGEEWGLERGDKYISLGIRNDNLYTDDSDIDYGGLEYAKGFSKIRWLSQTVEDKKIGKIFSYRTKLGLFSFKEGFKKATGQSYSDFTEEWEKAMNVYYNWREGLSEQTEKIGKNLKNIRCKYLSVIKSSPDKKAYAFTGIKTLNTHSQKLYYYDKNKNKLKVLAEKGIKPNFSFNSDGNKIVFSRYHYGKHGSIVSDLYIIDLKTGKQTQVTKSSRAYEPVFTNNNEIIFLKNDGSASNFYRCDEQGKNIKKLTDFSNERQFADMSISHCYHKVISSYFDAQEKTYGIFVFDLESGDIKEIKTQTQSRFPQFSPENTNEILYTSYDSDVANVYRYSLDTGIKEQITNQSNYIKVTDWISKDEALAIIQTKRHTNTPIAMNPYRKPEFYDGKIKPRYEKWRKLSPQNEVTVKEKKVDGKFVGKYHSLSNFRMLSFMPLPFYLNEKLTIGFENIWADMLGKNNLMGMFALNYNDLKKSNYMVHYLNKASLFDIQAYFQYQDVTTFNYADKKSIHELIKTAHVNFSYRIENQKSFDSHYFYVGYGYEKSNVLNIEDFSAAINSDIKNGFLEPPESYIDSGPYFTYRYKNLQPYTRFPFDGTGVLLRYSFSDPFLGSDYSYHYLQLSSYRIFPLHDKLNLFIYGDIKGLIGETAPQNMLGINKYRTFYHVSHYSNEIFVRGGDKYYPSNRLFSATVEIRSPYFENRINGVVFFDFAMIWDNSFKSFKDSNKFASHGLELQLFSSKIFTAAFGFARDFYDKNGEWKFYFMLKNVLPF